MTTAVIGTGGGINVTGVIAAAGSLGAGAQVTFQPAAGTKAQVTVTADSVTNAMEIEYTTDGANWRQMGTAQKPSTGTSSTAGLTANGFQFMIFCDNTQYFRLNNTSGGAIDYAIQGVTFQ